MAPASAGEGGDVAGGGGTKIRMIEPPIGADSAPFWEATRVGKLLVQWCTRCDVAIFYPRAFCPTCGTAGSVGQGLEWREASGAATVYACTVEHNPAATGSTFSGGEPYVVALVELAEGVRMLTNIVGVPAAGVTIGMAVTLTWEPLSDGRQLPQFRPTATTSS
jgi:uncharacterized OB-fold protein